jgi:hypothetical protein
MFVNLEPVSGAGSTGDGRTDVLGLLDLEDRDSTLSEISASLHQ